MEQHGELLAYIGGFGIVVIILLAMPKKPTCGKLAVRLALVGVAALVMFWLYVDTLTNPDPLVGPMPAVTGVLVVVVSLVIMIWSVARTLLRGEQDENGQSLGVTLIVLGIIALVLLGGGAGLLLR